jgi:AmiR/NasT family two-component response regulator
MNRTDSITVLIAEDDALISEGIGAQLNRLGYGVAGRAYDGTQAVELAIQKRPDVVLMDLQMIDPETGREDPQAGLQAARALQEQCPAAVVLLTAHESTDLIRRASEAGVGAYLVKPAADNDLDRAITIARARFGDLLRLRQMTAELTTALSKVKTLTGLLPICAGCKKIRDDQGYWQQVEQYIQKHSNATFSHGLCPECCQRLYPGVFPAPAASDRPA